MKQREWLQQIAGAFARTIDDRDVEPGLYSGDAGVALFLAYYGAATSEPTYLELAETHLERAVDRVQELGWTFANGFTGVAWALEHLPGRILAPNEEPPNEGTDELLQAILADDAQVEWEFMHGAIGVGVYALDCLPRPAARRIIELVVGRLEQSAIEQPRGIAWLTRRDRAFPDGVFNLGMAHGIPCAIAFLAEVAAAGIAAAPARRLLDGAVAWLLSHRTPVGLPAFVQLSSEVIPARNAWCYGDLGVAFSLIAAGRRVNEPSWEAAGLELARAAAARPVADARVSDASFCHGAAGLAFMCMTLHRATHEPVFAEAAARWFDHTLSLRHDDGFAGVRYFARLRGQQWEPNRGLLEGAAGVGLVLLAREYPELAPGWARAFLLSLPG